MKLEIKSTCIAQIKTLELIFLAEEKQAEI